MSLAVWISISVVLLVVALVVASGFVATRPKAGGEGRDDDALPYPIMAHTPEDEEGHTPLHGLHSHGGHEAGHSGGHHG